MPNANLLKAFTPYAPGIQPTWSVGQIRSALTAHEQGQFSQSALLVDAMGRCDRLVGVLGTRIKGLLGSTFRLTPSDPDEAKAVEIAEELEDHWWEMFPEDELADLLKWRLMMGFALAELAWNRSSIAWRPRLKVWHPQYLRHDQDTDEWILTAKEEAQIVITPGDGHWILMGPGQRPYMHGAVRSLSVPWIIRQFALRDWARYSERHGLPLLKAMVPSTALTDEKASFFNDVRQLATETTVTLPQNVDGDGASYDLELLEARDTQPERFKLLLDWVNDAYAVHLLGNNLTSEVRGGSFAASKTGDEVRQDIRKADSEELSSNLREQALSKVVEFNVGNTDLTPWPHWDTEPPEDKQEGALAIKTFGESIAALSNAGWEVDNVEELGEKFGLMLTKKEVPDPPPAAPFQPPAAPAGGDEVDPSRDAAPDGTEATSRVKLASGDDPANAQGFIEGQTYIDDVADDGAAGSATRIRPDLKRILNIVETSQDYGDMRARLREAYAGMDVEDFADLVEKALVLSDLAGRHAVLQDL